MGTLDWSGMQPLDVLYFEERSEDDGLDAFQKELIKTGMKGTLSISGRGWILRIQDQVTTFYKRLGTQKVVHVQINMSCHKLPTVKDEKNPFSFDTNPPSPGESHANKNKWVAKSRRLPMPSEHQFRLTVCDPGEDRVLAVHLTCELLPQQIPCRSLAKGYRPSGGEVDIPSAVAEAVRRFLKIEHPERYHLDISTEKVKKGEELFHVQITAILACNHPFPTVTKKEKRDFELDQGKITETQWRAALDMSSKAPGFCGIGMEQVNGDHQIKVVVVGIISLKYESGANQLEWATGELTNLSRWSGKMLSEDDGKIIQLGIKHLFNLPPAYDHTCQWNLKYDEYIEALEENSIDLVGPWTPALKLAPTLNAPILVKPGWNLVIRQQISSSLFRISFQQSLGDHEPQTKMRIALNLVSEAVEVLSLSPQVIKRGRLEEYQKIRRKALVALGSPRNVV